MKRIFVTLCVLYAVFSITWNYVLTGINRLILIPIAIAILPVLGFYIRAVAMHTLSKHGKEFKQQKKEEEKYNRETQKKEFLREYDAKIKPLYNEGRVLFASLMKQGKVHNYELGDLKGILNNRLGKYAEHYHNYKFKNDANEIYVKMKNFHLNEYDWELILNFLHALEGNIPVKKERQMKPKEVTE